jgi:hypothetical protein
VISIRPTVARTSGSKRGRCIRQARPSSRNTARFQFGISNLARRRYCRVGTSHAAHIPFLSNGITWCGLLALVCLAAKAQISPGPLSQAHSSLEGSTNCTACHSFGLGTRKFKCTGCHAEIRRRLADHRGFHARAVKNVAGDQECAACHTDHLGPKFNIVKWEPSHDEFDHRQTGYVLEGAHSRVAAVGAIRRIMCLQANAKASE